MYTEEKKGADLSIKTFILSLVFVVLFILLLMWLLPISKTSNGTSNREDLLQNRIFNSNIQEMENAAIYYFTKDRLPKNSGDSITLSLQQMLDAKVLFPFTDKDGNSCDTYGSYATLTKKQDEYVMKINLKCPEDENFVLVNMGTYSYCASTICEKRQDIVETNSTSREPTEDNNNSTDPTPIVTKTDPVCELYISSGNVGNNGWYTTDATIRFKTKNATSSGASLAAFGLGFDSNADFNNRDSLIVNTDGITTVYGYVKDTDGKTATCSVTVKKDTEIPNCKLVVLSGNKNENGNFISDVVVGFDTKFDTTSGINSFGLTNSATVTYNQTAKFNITKEGTHKIYGYVEDVAGHTAKCDMTVVRERNITPTSSTPSCSLRVTSGILGNNGWYTGNVSVGFYSKTSTNGAYITSFGIGPSENYSGNSSYIVDKDGTTIVYGFVKDSNGNTGTCSLTINKDASKPGCILKVSSGTHNSIGVYTSDVQVGFAFKADTMSGINSFGIGLYENYNGKTSYTVANTGTTTVYGYIKDEAGNIGTCSIKVTRGSTLEYQYKKKIGNQYSDWTNWTISTYNPSNPPSFGKYTLIEIEDLGKTQVVDYYKESLGNALYQNKQVKVGTVKQTYCKGYNYYRDVNDESITYAIKDDTDWQYVGKVTTTGSPTDTLAVKYEFVGFDWKCSGCEVAPREIWNKYTRTVSVATSSNALSTSGVPTRCTETETRTVELYDTISIFVDYEIIKTPVYKEVYSYRQRTRSLLKKAYTDYQWSTYNDTNLINNGYVYTGNTRTFA